MFHATSKVCIKKTKVVEMDTEDLQGDIGFDDFNNESELEAAASSASESLQLGSAGLALAAPQAQAQSSWWNLFSSAAPAPPQQQQAAAAPPAPSSAPPGGPELRRAKKKIRWAQKEARRNSTEQNQEKVFRQAVDTSVISIKLGSLAENATSLMTGDPTFCRNNKCKAVLSKISKLLDSKQAAKEPACAKINLEDGQQAWICEFCSTAQVVDLAPEEIPSSESVDYILEPAEAKTTKDDETKVIFVVDTSGSMCVTKEVDGSIKLKGMQKRRDEFEHLLEAGDERFQARSQKTYISRLQCVQAAVDSQLAGLKKTHPKRRVGLVTFSNDCTLYGDCTNAPVTCAGDKLGDQAKLSQIGSQFPVAQPISSSEAAIKKRLFELEEKGQTCLGPALLIGVNVAAQTKGSQVILCTDGLANVGLGSLEGPQAEAAAVFYEELAASAARAGVSVSTISITDQEASLENLGRVADATGGTVERIDPLKLTEQFNGILENQVLAVQVQATMLLHHGMQFRGLDTAEAKEQSKTEQGVDKVHRLSKDVGNVFADTELFYEYQVRPDFQDQAEGLKHVPFQVQIRYTRLDGSKCMRVLSQSREVTSDEDEAVKDVDHAILAANTIQRCGMLAQAGDYEGARLNNVAWGHFMRSMPSSSAEQHQRQQQVLSRWAQDTRSIDNMMQTEQRSENAEGSALRFMGKAAKMQGRSARRGDAISSKMYKSKKISSATMSK